MHGFPCILLPRRWKPTSPDLTAVANALRKIFRAIRLSSHQAEATLGISGAQLFVLQQVAEHPHVSLREVAALTLTDQSSVSVVVSRLVLRGLVVRQTSKVDARRVELSLTSVGRNLVREAPELAQGGLMRSLRGVDVAKLRHTRHVLEQLIDDLGAANESAQMFSEDGEGPSAHGPAGLSRQRRAQARAVRADSPRRAAARRDNGTERAPRR